MADLDIDKILDRAIRLARLENRGFQSFIAPSMAEALREVRRILNESGEITSQRQLQQVETAIKRTIQSQQGWSKLTDELIDLGMLENEFMASALALADKAATRDIVERLANNTMMVLKSGERYNVGLWTDFIKKALDTQASAVANIARLGYADGLTAKEMYKKASRIMDGVSTNEATALLRTGYTHFSTVGRRAFAQANKDIIEKEVPLVTFDSRTSNTCISIGSQYGVKGWDVGQSPIGYPPYHFNCRTTIVALPKGTGLSGTRSTQKGQVPANQSINTFFKNNPKIAQDALGPERYQLWKDGKIKLKDLTDANLRPLTLDELKG